MTPAGGHRDLEGAVRDVLAEGAAVLRAAGRDRARRGRPARYRAVPGSPVKLSTGVMVLYADDESFTFMTPEGHTLSAWITFSAYRDGDVTVAQAQALERPSDPFDELAYMLGGNRMNDRFWRETLINLGRAMGATDPVVDVEVVCIDKRRQWRHAAQRPQQRHASDDAPHADRPRPLDHRPKLGVGRRMTTPDLDAIVVGAGPNGLAAALTLARAGSSVRVYEAAATIGGGTRTAELTLPGFRHDVCSTILPLTVASPFFRTVDWDARGVELVHPDAPLAHALDGGRAAVLERSFAATAAGLDR